VTSRDVVDRCRGTSWTILASHGLVAPFRVQVELADELSAGREDPHITVLHQDQYSVPFVPSTDVGVVELAAVAERDFSAADLVLADPTAPGG
jgi:hypothetical protein